MMLPSGNDAAQSLGLYFGVILLFKGNVEPNTYLTVVEDKVIDQRIELAKTQPT